MKLSFNWMKQQIKGVLFDLDGTLLDSMSVWDDIDVEYLAGFGHDLPSDYQKKIEGLSFKEVAVYTKQRFGIPDSIEQMMSDWNEMAYEFYRDRVQLKPGALRLLKALKAVGIPCGIATSNSVELLNAVLDSRKLRDYFDVIVTGSEVEHGKPAPDIYLYAAGRIGLKPSECLVFEDVEAGIRSARDAGMTVCAVYDARSKLSVSEAEELSDYYIDGFEEIFDETEEG